jgi:hypothetical protein
LIVELRIFACPGFGRIDANRENKGSPKRLDVFLPHREERFRKEKKDLEIAPELHFGCRIEILICPGFGRIDANRENKDSPKRLGFQISSDKIHRVRQKFSPPINKICASRKQLFLYLEFKIYFNAQSSSKSCPRSNLTCLAG